MPSVPAHLPPSSGSHDQAVPLGVPVMMTDDNITKKAFEDFTAQVVRGIAKRNAEAAPTKKIEVTT